MSFVCHFTLLLELYFWQKLLIFLDGATLSYDLYQAQEEHPDGGDFTLAVCPGIGNNSESVYIR